MGDIFFHNHPAFFIFDLHLKKAGSVTAWERSLVRALIHRTEYLEQIDHLAHFLNYLILPSVVYWATVGLLYLNPFDFALKQIFILLSTIALTINFWYLKSVFLDHKKSRYIERQLFFLVKLYAIFVAFTVSFGISRYFGYPGEVFWVLVAGITYVLMYQAFFQHHHVKPDVVKFLLLSSLLMGALGFMVFQLWNVNYFSGALVLAAVYNTMWGIIHHKYLDKNLTREIVYEYLAVLFVILVIVFSSTNFAERV